MDRAAFATLTLLSLGVAGYAFVAYGGWPLGAAVHPDMRASFVAHPGGAYVHVFASAVALILGPLQFMPRWRARHPAWHRWAGRLYLGVGVAAGGAAGLYLALHAYGGIVSQLGFGGLALAWLYTGGRAYAAIRAGDVVAHRRWMVRNFALSLAAVTLRLWLPAAVVAGVPFALAYPAVAWLCWVLNLWVAQRLLQRGAVRSR